MRGVCKTFSSMSANMFFSHHLQRAFLDPFYQCGWWEIEDFIYWGIGKNRERGDPAILTKWYEQSITTAFILQSSKGNFLKSLEERISDEFTEKKEKKAYRNRWLMNDQLRASPLWKECYEVKQFLLSIPGHGFEVKCS